MQVNIDHDVQAVLEFMQGNIVAGKLVSVAESLPGLARLLWEHLPQEPLIAMTLEKPKSVECNPSQPVAI